MGKLISLSYPFSPGFVGYKMIYLCRSHCITILLNIYMRILHPIISLRNPDHQCPTHCITISLNIYMCTLHVRLKGPRTPLFLFVAKLTDLSFLGYKMIYFMWFFYGQGIRI